MFLLCLAKKYVWKVASQWNFVACWKGKAFAQEDFKLFTRHVGYCIVTTVVVLVGR